MLLYRTVAAAQVPPEVLTWLQTLSLDKPTLTRVANMTFETMPTTTNAEANTKAISSMLHISEAQVWASCPALIHSVACFVRVLTLSDCQMMEVQHAAEIGLRACNACAAANGALVSRLRMAVTCVRV